MPLASAARARLLSTLGASIAILLWSLTRSPIAATLALVATVLASFAWIAPNRYASVQRRLDTAARALAAGVSWVVLGLVYFGLFAPLRLWRATTRHDALQRRRDPGATTYLRALPATPPRFDRQF